MPKKLTADELEANYNKWRASAEFMQIEKFQNERRDIVAVEMSTKDINDDWSKYLDELFKLV
jgi:hypothetical protein